MSEKYIFWHKLEYFVRWRNGDFPLWTDESCAGDSRWITGEESKSHDLRHEYDAGRNSKLAPNTVMVDNPAYDLIAPAMRQIAVSSSRDC